MADKSKRVSLESVGLKPRDDNPLNFKVDSTDDSDIFLGTLNKSEKEAFNRLKKLYESTGLNLIKELSKDKIKIGKELKFAKGGTPMATQIEARDNGILNPIPNQEEQMEMMLEGGGLKDEGGTIDPVSGNEVPDGATQEGVRDDVPAMLSEGEYVMNEASTRYHGVNKLNAMQEEAKQGYSQMEKDGLMGEPVDETEEALPFGMADLNVSDEEGRELRMADGGLVPNGFNLGGLEQGVYNAASGLFGGGAGGNSSTQRKLNPVQDTGMPQRRPQPTFGDSMGGAGGFTFKMYTHEDGRNMMVPFMNGIPMFNIPEGFTLVDPNMPTPTPEPTPVDPPEEVEKPSGPPEAGGDQDVKDIVTFDTMSPEQVQQARDFYNKDSKAKSLLQRIPFVKDLLAMNEKALRDYDRKTLMQDIKKEPKPNLDKLAKQAQQNKQAEEDKKQREKNKEDPTIGGPGGDVTSGGVTSGVGTGTTGVGLAGEDYDPMDFEGPTGGSNIDSGSGVSANDFDFGMGGPDGPGDFGGGGGSVDADQGPGPFNKGGLAGVKPKKKMKTYKKGGLATR